MANQVNPIKLFAIDFDRLTNLVLVALYEHYMHSSAEYIDINKLGIVVPYGSLNAIRDVLSDLEAASLANRGSRRVPLQHTNFLGAINAKIEYEDVPTNSYRLTRKGAQKVCALGEDHINRIASELIFEDRRPANERLSEDWEPIKLDLESPKFSKAISETEKTLDRIQADNGYASNSPDERNGLLYTMRSAFDALKSGCISRATFFSGLLKPLRYIADKFSGSALGEAGKRALDALLSLVP